MARTQPKTSTSSSAPVVAAPVTPAAPAASAVKKVVHKEPEAPVVVVPVAAPAEQTPASDTNQSREDRHKAVLKAVDDQLATLKALRASLVANYKADGTDLKTAQKSGGRRRRATPVDENAPKRAPSGITKPTKVSDAMCEFMGRPKGDLIARTEVTKFITNYIKEQNLKDETVKRHINPDAKLRALLSIPQADQLTYFNLQKYMTSHFPAKVQA
jgi:chromatin remodeling complex protein RSC6